MVRIPRPSADAWHSAFGFAYLTMATNAMLAVAGLPLLVLLATTRPSASWPALALAAVTATPALSATFAVFRRYTQERCTDVLRTFWRAWAAGLSRSLAIGALTVGAVVVLVVDVMVLAGHAVGALVTPVLVVLAALALATGLLALVAGVERPDARWRDLLWVALVLAVRRWYLTAVSFLALGLLAGLFTLHPAWALGLAAAPLLQVAWGNSRYSLRPVLPEGHGTADRLRGKGDRVGGASAGW